MRATMEIVMLARSQIISDSANDSRARRAARRIGLVAKKSRWRKNSSDNVGGFQLVDLRGNYVVAGPRFDMTADEVIAYCEGAH
jgi:hypothetical protein